MEGLRIVPIQLRLGLIAVEQGQSKALIYRTGGVGEDGKHGFPGPQQYVHGFLVVFRLAPGDFLGDGLGNGSREDDSGGFGAA